MRSSGSRAATGPTGPAAGRQDTASALCFHCLRGQDTASALCFHCLRGQDTAFPRERPGARVELAGLSSTELNGEAGAVVGSFDKLKGRYAVQLDSGRSVRVLPANVVPAAGAAGERNQRDDM